MRSIHVWSDKVQDKDKMKYPIYEICFHPDGSHLIATCGILILVYNSTTGELIQTVRGHKETVYSLDYAADGKKFASGGADKHVIIWGNKMEGLVKYTHTDIVQVVRWNPVTGYLASCSTTDFGFWSTEQKTVTKFKAQGRITSASWTNDGMFLALGLFSGSISFRNRAGEEVVKVDRQHGQPVWSLSWNPVPQKAADKSDKITDTLLVADWDQRLSFYTVAGAPVGKERSLGYDPCFVTFFPRGDFFVVGGSDKTATLWTREGVRLSTICEREDWIWTCKVKPNQDYVAVGCNDGTISVFQVVFLTVHGLFKDRYAYRENMTDIVIQHLSKSHKARIKCRDHAKKIAIYSDRLAVQLSDRIIIYEVVKDDGTEMHYRIKEKLPRKLDCNLLVVTMNHIILCLEKKIQMYTFTGEKVHEWQMDALIRYIKVLGGPVGKEGLLVGLKSGQILLVFLGSSLPIPIIKLSASIRCIDISLFRKKLSVVDEHGVISVHDLKTKQLVWSETGVTSVAWNVEHDEMVSYSGNRVVSMRAGNLAPYQTKMSGFVVGFMGSKIFCLNSNSMQTVDVPQGNAMEKVMEKKDLAKAYSIACLGVTDGDWKKLGVEALESLQLDIAKKVFVRLKDLKFLELIYSIERLKAGGVNNQDLFLAEIAAYQSRFSDAARLYRKAGFSQKAIDMYTELNMWEMATKLAEETTANVQDVLKLKAQNQEDKNDMHAAALTYVEVGDYIQAINIYVQNKYYDELIELSRKLNKLEVKALAACVNHFRKIGNLEMASEMFMKMGDLKGLMALHVERQLWDEAFKLGETSSELLNQVYLPYAKWLSLNDRFVEAQENFRKAGRTDLAVQVMEELSMNAVAENRFQDASYYYHLLSLEHLRIIPDSLDLKEMSSEDRLHVDLFYHFKTLSELYFAYHAVVGYLLDPFTSHQIESLFNMCRFILNMLPIVSPFNSGDNTKIITPISQDGLPPNLSIGFTLFALAKTAHKLNANHITYQVLDRLYHHYYIPHSQDVIERMWILSKGRRKGGESDDSVAHMNICFSCATDNPPLDWRWMSESVSERNKANLCARCGEPFIRGFYRFENLPVVSFVCADAVVEKTVCDLFRGIWPDEKKQNVKNNWQEKKSEGGGDQLILSEEDESLANLNEIVNEAGPLSGSHVPNVLKVSELNELTPSRVFIIDRKKKCMPPQFYKTALPDSSISMCKSCFHFFDTDDYEFLVLQNNSCPFCRVTIDDLS